MTKQREKHDDSFSVYFKSFRDKKNITLFEVAKQMNISLTTLYDIENRIARPSIEFCMRFSETFLVPFNEVMDICMMTYMNDYKNGNGNKDLSHSFEISFI